MTDTCGEGYITTAHDAGAEGRARDLWRAAIDALPGQGGARAQRVAAAFEGRHGGDLAVLVVAEYLSAMAAADGGLGGLRDAIAEARKVAALVERLERQLWTMSRSLAFGDLIGEGERIAGALHVAARAMGEARGGPIAFALEHLAEAEAHAPGKASGADGMIGKLRVDPTRALAMQLGRVWLARGLTLAGGRSGDGLDEIVAYVVEATDRRRPPKGSRKWLEVVMAAARDALSTENRPPELPE